MSKRATPVLLAVILGLGVIFRGDWTTLSLAGFALGFLVAFVALRLDRQLRTFDQHVRWTILKEWAIGSAVIALIAAGFAYWRGSADVAMSGAAAFTGVAFAALLFEILARRKALA